jgi:hypothetical protein
VLNGSSTKGLEDDKPKIDKAAVMIVQRDNPDVSENSPEFETCVEAVKSREHQRAKQLMMDTHIQNAMKKVCNALNKYGTLLGSKNCHPDFQNYKLPNIISDDIAAFHKSAQNVKD